MPSRLLIASSLSVALASPALAEVPRVVADIPPVHSLVAMVMGDLGAPDLLVKPGMSPHGYAMRPSEAGALQDAGLVFWVGEGLEPWLEGPLEALAAEARVIELLDVPGVTEHDFREGAAFAPHDDHEGEGHDEHGHDDEADDEHGHDEHGHEEEGHEEDGHDGHDHSGRDPHAWLDPDNALVWLDVIAGELAALDAANAETYHANAAAAKAEIVDMSAEVEASLAPVRGKPFVVFHDAYQYFETRFDILAAGSIRLGDSSDPSPARIAEISDRIEALQVVCAFAEPQFNANMIEAVFRDQDARVAVLDPLGADLEPGADLYPQLIRNLGANLAGCLK